MKHYEVFFSDYPDDPWNVRATSSDEAEKKGYGYIEQNGLNATVIRINEIKL